MGAGGAIPTGMDKQCVIVWCEQRRGQKVALGQRFQIAQTFECSVVELEIESDRAGCFADLRRNRHGWEFVL